MVCDPIIRLQVWNEDRNPLHPSWQTIKGKTGETLMVVVVRALPAFGEASDSEIACVWIDDEKYTASVMQPGPGGFVWVFNVVFNSPGRHIISAQLPKTANCRQSEIKSVSLNIVGKTLSGGTRVNLQKGQCPPSEIIPVEGILPLVSEVEITDIQPIIDFLEALAKSKQLRPYNEIVTKFNVDAGDHCLETETITGDEVIPITSMCALADGCSVDRIDVGYAMLNNYYWQTKQDSPTQDEPVCAKGLFPLSRGYRVRACFTNVPQGCDLYLFVNGYQNMSGALTKPGVPQIMIEKDPTFKEETLTTLGNTSSFSSPFSGEHHAVKFTTTQARTISSLKLNVKSYFPSGGGNGRMALYTDSSDEPSSLIVQSGEVALSPGWVNFNITNTSLAAGDYWVALQVDEDINIYNDSTSAREAISNTISYGSFPATWSHWTYGGEEWNVKVNHLVEE